MNDQLISWLMDAAAKAQGRGGAVPMGQQPQPFMPTPDALLAQREQQAKELLGQAYAPSPIQEPPVTPSERAARVLAGLSDILTAKAHAYNAAPPPDALNELRRRREERMMRDYAIGEEGKRAGLAAKQRVAEYELGQIEGEKERRSRSQERMSEAKAEAQARAAEKSEARGFEAEQLKAEQEFKRQEAERERDWRAKQEALDRDIRMKIATIEKAAEGDKTKEKSVQAQKELLAGTRLKMATEAKPTLRDDPNANVEEMRQDYLDEMKALGMEPEFIEAALAYFDDIANRFKRPAAQPSGPGIGSRIMDIIGGLGKGASMTSPSPSKIAARGK